MKKFIMKRPLFCMCMTAVVSAFICSYLSSRYIFVYCCVLAFSALFIVHIKFELKKTVLMMLVFSIAMSVSFLFYYKYNYETLFKYNSQTVSARCVVLDKSETTTGDYKSVKVKCEVTDENGQCNGKSFKAKVYYEEDFDFIPSQSFNLDLTFFDKSENAPFDGDGVHIAATGSNIIVTKPFDKTSFSYNCYRLREFVSRKIVCKTPAETVFLRGMILGDKSGISKIFSNKFTEIGMSHVMAVSGMNLIFAVVFMNFILLIFNVSYRVRCMFAFVSVAAFTVLSGFSVSCIRAAIMITILYIGKIYERYSDPLTSLSLAAFIILAFSPYNIRCASFVLSASATFGLIVLSPMLNSLWKFKFKNYYVNTTVRSIVGALNMSLAANIACMPVFVLMFKEVNLLAPISNILLLIPIQAMFYLGFLGLILSFSPFLAGFVQTLISWIYNFIQAVTNFEYNLPFTSVNEGYTGFYLIFALFAVLIIGIYIYYQIYPKQKVYPYIISYAAFCLILSAVYIIPNYNTIKAEFVDVGMGNCTVFSKNENAVIVDCGGSISDKLYDSLRSVKHIEMVALTHVDDDHIEYLNYLVNSYEIDKIVYPEFCEEEKITKQLEIARMAGAEICCLSEDTTYDVLDGATISVFVKQAYITKLDNNTCALYKFKYNKSCVVCPGDMDVNQDYAYLCYGNQLDCDILVAGHHGSGSSSLLTILKLYSPDYTVISVGKNIYGLPDKRAVTRIESVSKVLRTDEMSTITFKLNKKGYKLVNKT